MLNDPYAVLRALLRAEATRRTPTEPDTAHRTPAEPDAARRVPCEQRSPAREKRRD
ncbi:hypothetical protein [Streptomyces sp. SID5910]|uniref:hypothetical protein n=1 Tax=Streptomyces sp. SID5910 TaxID=2690312 RepID=UPI0019261810|nr:hypothetical protein [Streptomyces sp. SID5910]